MCIVAHALMSLKAVDTLNITFLVDNNIEWMTKLPPGFTHELQQHIQQPGHGFYDELKGVPVLDFDKFCCGAHGFAALIESQIEGENESYLTLFDTGPDSQSLVRNIRAMQVSVERIERVIISHWHSDHTGGLLSFLSLRNNVVESSNQTALACTVDVHPDRPIARGIAPGPAYDKVLCALPPDPTFEAIERLKGIVDTQKYGHTVAGGSVWVSGEIPRHTEFETGLHGGMRWVEEAEGGKWVSDSRIMDERYTVVDIAGKDHPTDPPSSCSHAGIVNVVKDALKTFSRPIYMIIGGLHLAGPEYGPRIPKTVEFLSETLRPAPTYILPMHCSGFEAKLALENALGNGCVPAGVGHRIHLESDREIDNRLLPATYE